MRKLLLMLMLALSFGAAAQVKYEVDTVLQAPGKSKQQIYDALKVWLADWMRDSKDVSRIEDEDNGILMGKCAVPFNVKGVQLKYLSGLVHLSIRIDIREGRYKVRMYNWWHESFTKEYAAWSIGEIYTTVPDGLKYRFTWSYKKFLPKFFPFAKEVEQRTFSTMQEWIANETTDDDW